MTNQYMTKLYHDLLSNSPQTVTIDIPADMGTGQISQVVTKQGAVVSDWKMNYFSDMNVQGVSSEEYIQMLVGLTEDDFTSLTPEQIEKFKEKYQSPEVFTLFNGELHVMKMPPQEQKEQKESRKKDAQQKNPAKGKKKNRSGEAR